MAALTGQEGANLLEGGNFGIYSGEKFGCIHADSVTPHRLSTHRTAFPHWRFGFLLIHS
jgi:hypothetical protein